MDVSRLTRGEQIAGVSGLALLLIMFIFDWFTVDAGLVSVGGNAWDTMEFIRFIILLAALAGIAEAVLSATQSTYQAPVAVSALAAGLGILAVVLILFRILSPPDGGVDGLDIGRGIGVFLGLIAAGGVAYGGWVAMQEEGTSFGDQTDKFQGGGDPPPPPPPAAPPAGGPPAA